METNGESANVDSLFDNDFDNFEWLYKDKVRVLVRFDDYNVQGVAAGEASEAFLSPSNDDFFPLDEWTPEEDEKEEVPVDRQEIECAIPVKIDPNQTKQQAALNRKRVREEDNKVRLEGRLMLPSRLFQLCNEGDLSGIRSLVNEQFDEKCSFKTHAMKTPHASRDSIIDCFELMADQFPDGLYYLRNARLGKNGDVAFRFDFDGCSTCSLPSFKGNPYLVSFPDLPEGRCPVADGTSKVGAFTEMVMRETRARHWFPFEREALLRLEARMKEQKTLSHFSLELSGKMSFAPAAACASPSDVRVVRMGLFYKIKKVEARHAKIIIDGATAT